MNPVQVVSADFKIEEKVLQILENESRPVVVVSVVGPYRSGKSYLLNRLMRKTDGFPLGSTIEAKTKGIWFWMGDFFEDKNTAMVLLDTEGLNDTNKEDSSHDVKIFMLALLLSSVFIYNTKGNIDSRALDGLHHALEMSKYISTDASSGPDITSQNFIWAIRDLYLLLQINGNSVSPNEYLESILKTKERSSSDQSKLAKRIQSFFPQRDCLVFPFPTTDELKMNHLDDLPENELAPEFKAAGNNFVNFIKSHAQPKKINQTLIKGRSFGLLIKKYVESTLEKNISIESSFDYICKQENDRAIRAAQNQLEENLNRQKLPVSAEVFERVAAEAKQMAINTFMGQAINLENHQDCKVKFNQIVDELIKQFQAKNVTASTTKCEQVLKELFVNDVETKLSLGEFSKSGGLVLLKSALEKVEQNYMNENDLGPQTITVLEHFKINKFAPLIETISQTDEAITEKEKKLREIETESKRQEDVVRMQQEEEAEARAQMETLKIQHEAEVARLGAKAKQEMEENLAKAKLEQEKETQRIQAEQDAKMKEIEEQNRAQAAALQATITALQNNPPVVYVRKRRKWWKI